MFGDPDLSLEAYRLLDKYSLEELLERFGIEPSFVVTWLLEEGLISNDDEQA